jgi:hypothetical protein
VNELRGPVVVDLLAQAVNIDLDKICLAVEMTIPHVFDDLAARDKFGSAKKQEFEERKLLAGKWNHFLSAVGTAAVAVQFESGF